MKKPRNAEDATLRNVTASQRRDDALHHRISHLRVLAVEQEDRIAMLEARIKQLEGFALVTAPREWQKLRKARR